MGDSSSGPVFRHRTVVAHELTAAGLQSLSVQERHQIIRDLLSIPALKDALCRHYLCSDQTDDVVLAELVSEDVANVAGKDKAANLCSMLRLQASLNRARECLAEIIVADPNTSLAASRANRSDRSYPFTLGLILTGKKEEADDDATIWWFLAQQTPCRVKLSDRDPLDISLTIKPIRTAEGEKQEEIHGVDATLITGAEAMDA